MYLFTAILWSIVGCLCAAQFSVGPLVNEKILGKTDASVLSFADLVCVIQPNTDIQSRWLFNGENVLTFSARTRVLNGNIFMNGTYGTTLFIRDISYLDAGTYTCEVLNASSPVSQWISATVELKLEVRLKAVQQQIMVYNDVLAVELGCDMAGYVRPDDHLHWFRGEDIISQDSKYELEFRNGSQTAQKGGSTTIPSRLSVVRALNPEIEDTGVYKCVISGTELTSYIKLVVLEASAPSGFPQNVAATTISAVEIVVTWDEVLENERNGTITHYEVRYSQSTFSSIPATNTVLTDGPVLELLLQSLEEFVEYNFTVRAHTAIGPGPFSPHVSNKTFEDRPSTAPLSLSVVSFNVSTLGVTWERPDEITINGILRHYVLEYCSTLGEALVIDNDSCVVLQNVSRDTTSVTLIGLREYTTYSVKVSAFTIHPGPFASRFQNTGGTVLLMNPFSVAELGPDHVVPAINFSCTVVNEGFFIWQWRLPNGSHLTSVSSSANIAVSGRYTLYRSSGTNTSILEVGGLSYRHEGVYQCEVRHKAWDVVLGTNSSLLQLQYVLRANATAVIAFLHQPSVQLACNLYGYVPSVQVRWFQENGTEIQNNSKHSISLPSQHSNGHMVQVGGVAPQPSTMSILSIYTTLQSDSGTYTCAVHNSTAAITLTVQVPETLSPGSITAIIVCIVLAVVLVVMVTIAVIAVVYCRNRKRYRRKQQPATVTTPASFIPTEEEIAHEKSPQLPSASEVEPAQEVPPPNAACAGVDIVPTENDIAPEKSPQLPSASEVEPAQEVPPPNAACAGVDIVPTENDIAPEKSPQLPSASEVEPTQEVPPPNAACAGVDIGIPLYTEQEASFEYGAETKSSPHAGSADTANIIDGPDESIDKPTEDV